MITCFPEMQSQIEKMVHEGHASFKIFQCIGYLNIWQPATLDITRKGYKIKGSSVVAEKFSTNMVVTIPRRGSPAEFTVVTGSGTSDGCARYLLKTDNTCFRDAVVLTLRAFLRIANDRRGSWHWQRKVDFLAERVLPLSHA
ncbi:hypothetical protein C1H46_004904 [Malus baccata]|uniref:DUF7046 domain-containing protein n=1 Tax=Malus baccata TaxID=106549 RepID=A0A540NEF5_MALBA|nr:hypothetical protein C1H46_004904 [Malus baccata]